MQEKIVEIKEGIKLHIIQTDIFKTDLFGIWLTTPLIKEYATQNALIELILKRGSSRYGIDNDFNKKLEELYGTNLDCGIEKHGDNESLRFLAEAIRSQYVPHNNSNEELLENVIDVVLDMVFNPVLENGVFLENMLEVEKNKLSKIIKSKIDDKDVYALSNALNSMYGDNGFGLYKYGFEEDLENVNAEILTNHYKDLIQTCKIDIFISGKVNDYKIEDYLKNHELVKKLENRKANYVLNVPLNEQKETIDTSKEVFQSLDVTQGKLVIGLDFVKEKMISSNSTLNEENIIAVGNVYDAILGNGVNSKLFQNVREKAGLAYSIRSNYVYPKMNVLVRAGIEIGNYDKAVELIKVQLNDMVNGYFSDDDIDNAKVQLHATLESLLETQDAEMLYYLSQEISNINDSINDMMEKVKLVTKEQIIQFAKALQINTIYFLKD